MSRQKIPTVNIPNMTTYAKHIQYLMIMLELPERLFSIIFNYCIWPCDIKLSQPTVGLNYPLEYYKTYLKCRVLVSGQNSPRQNSPNKTDKRVPDKIVPNKILKQL